MPLLFLPVATISLQAYFEKWLFMWLLAFSIFAGFKWLTWRRTNPAGVPLARSIAYLVAWPGMDAEAFLTRTVQPGGCFKEWVFAAAKMAFGAAMLLAAVSAKLGTRPLVSAWTGMCGTILFLHFGLFQLIALSYRRIGIDAMSLMRRPLWASSLSDFWGRGWNTAFNQLAHDLLFRPLARPMRGGAALFFTFIASGLIHDLVISLPARGGYGLPTAYFGIQGLAVLFERSRAGRRLGLNRGWRGRAFMFAVTVIPLPLLLHSPFIHNVFLPMLHAIGRQQEAL
jgi:hypothetical protein